MLSSETVLRKLTQKGAATYPFQGKLIVTYYFIQEQKKTQLICPALIRTTIAFGFSRKLGLWFTIGFWDVMLL